MLKTLTVASLLLLASGAALGAEDLEFRAPAAPDGALTAAAMRSLAVRALPVYKNPDRSQFLANLSALQMVAGDAVAANATRDSLNEVRRESKTARPVDLSIIYDLYARARAIEAQRHIPFDQAFGQVFHESVTPLGDLSAFTVTRWLATPLEVFRSNFQRELDAVRGEQRISLSQAVDLVWGYLSFDAFRSFGPAVAPLISEDDHRRYIIDDAVLVRTPQRASISAVLVRPRSAPALLPALLEFTTYVGSSYDAMDCAAHGYAGLIAYARGRARSPDALVPYEHDGDDARAVIAWIARQKWSNGSVGMYGSGYGAFAAWAAAKRPAPALKALAASSPVVPGLDAPALDRVPGMSDSIYRRWLRHPPFDRYWQAMLPYAGDFSHIDIPVLATTGYYDVREPDAMYYFTQHLLQDPRANETLLVGPYDEDAMRRGPLGVLRGYALDRAALVDLKALRFQWFDHVLKSAPVPSLLTARVNFEVMGADEWRHSASLEEMANSTVRLYLDPSRAGGHFRLSGHSPSRKRYIELEIPLAAGGEAVSREPSGGEASGEEPAPIVAPEIASADSVTFVSGPLHRPMQLSGRLSGLLAFATNQRRLGLHLTLYELLPDGDYFKLFQPPDDLDVHEVTVRGRRRPLAPRRRQQYPFLGERLTSVELKTDARIVLVLAAELPGRPAAQMDPRDGAGPASHGGAASDAGDSSHGGDASRVPDASSDAHDSERGGARRRPRQPVLDVRWYGGSYIDLPVLRAESQPPVASPQASSSAPAAAPSEKPARAGPSSTQPAPVKAPAAERPRGK